MEQSPTFGLRSGVQILQYAWGETSLNSGSLCDSVRFLNSETFITKHVQNSFGYPLKSVSLVARLFITGPACVNYSRSGKSVYKLAYCMTFPFRTLDAVRCDTASETMLKYITESIHVLKAMRSDQCSFPCMKITH